MTKIKISMKLLAEQIHMCDVKAEYGDKYEQDIFDGIANLLSEINWALEEGEEIEIVKGEEE